MLLEINDLRARAEGKDILKGLNLSVNAGEVHAIMGPNGSGKSTLARVLAGHPGYEVTGGSITFDGKDLLDLSQRNGPARACSWRSSIPSRLPASTTPISSRRR